MIGRKEVFLCETASLLHTSFLNSSIPRSSQQKTCVMIKSIIEKFISFSIADLTDIYGRSFEGPVFLKNSSEILAAYKNALSSFSTDFKRNKLFINLGLFYEPIEYEIQKNVESFVEDGKFVVKRNSITGQFIPLKKTLQTVLGNPLFFEEVKGYVE